MLIANIQHQKAKREFWGRIRRNKTSPFC